MCAAFNPDDSDTERVNPLLSGSRLEEFEDDKIIQGHETIFAELNKIVEESIIEIQNRGAKSLDQFEREKEGDLKMMKENYEKKYIEQALEFSQNMGLDLQRLAKQQIKNVIDSIY